MKTVWCYADDLSAAEDLLEVGDTVVFAHEKPVRVMEVKELRPPALIAAPPLTRRRILKRMAGAE